MNLPYSCGLLEELKKIPGGYVYLGACSDQVCFPLKDGSILRFSVVDDDCCDPEQAGQILIDHYFPKMPTGITGPVFSTGVKE